MFQAQIIRADSPPKCYNQQLMDLKLTLLQNVLKLNLETSKNKSVLHWNCFVTSSYLSVSFWFIQLLPSIATMFQQTLSAWHPNVNC